MASQQISYKISARTTDLTRWLSRDKMRPVELWPSNSLIYSSVTHASMDCTLSFSMIDFKQDCSYHLSTTLVLLLGYHHFEAIEILDLMCLWFPSWKENGVCCHLSTGSMPGPLSVYTLLKSSVSSKMKLWPIWFALSLFWHCVSETLQRPAHSPYIAWLTADFLNISNKNLVAQLSLYLAISELRVCFIWGCLLMLLE